MSNPKFKNYLPTAIVDGRPVDISSAQQHITDHSVMYALGSFTGFVARVLDETGDGGKNITLFRPDEHATRLVGGAQLFGGQIDPEEIARYRLALIRNNFQHMQPGSPYYCRMSVHVHGDGLMPNRPSRQVGISAFMLPFNQDDAPLRMTISDIPKPPTAAMFQHHKLLGTYSPSILAYQNAVKRGYDDCIMMSSTGNVSEGSASNVLFEDGEGVIHTPRETDDLLPGITRRSAIEILRTLGVKVQERAICGEEIGIFSGAVATGSKMGIRPIKDIDSVSYKVETPNLTRLRDIYRVLSEGRMSDIPEQLREWVSILSFGAPYTEFGDKKGDIGNCERLDLPA